MKRREFLHCVVATSATVVAAEFPRVRVGMLGTGHSHFLGKLNAVLGNSDFELVGITENNAAARAKLQQDPKLAALKWMAEAEMLGDKSIHLIVVECRAWEAVPWGKKVIAAGKHLHLEKPPGNAYAPFKDLVEEARRKSYYCKPVICGVGTRAFPARSTPQRKAGSAKCSWFVER